MARFHIETILDPETGMVFAEVSSDASDELVVRSQPMYHTHEDADADVVKTLRAAWPDRDPMAVDPSIGV